MEISDELSVAWWSRVIPTEGCWEWIGARGVREYGSLTFKRKHYVAHRLGYEMLVGKIPDGFEIDHLCRNHSCVNPDHLEAVTHAVNMSRGIIANRTHCPAGHPYDDLSRMYADKGRRCVVCRRKQWRERNWARYGVPEKPRKLKALVPIREG